MTAYPHIMFRKQWKLAPQHWKIIGECEAYIDSINSLPIEPDVRQDLMQVALTKGAQATTAIEGNTLTDEEVKSIFEGQSLPPSKEYQEREVRNILDAMNLFGSDIIDNNRALSITPTRLKEFHEAVGKNLGENFGAIPGHFAQSQRVVGFPVYRAPRPEDVPELVDRLCRWLPQEFHEDTLASSIVEAIVAHVYIEWIHPFDDGNGRTGRLVEFCILLGAGVPAIASHIMSNHYNMTRPEYNSFLARSSDSKDLTEFIGYALLGLRDGLRGVLTSLQNQTFDIMWDAYVYRVFDKRPIGKRKVFKRRRALALAMRPGRFYTLEDLAIVTADLARAYAQVTDRTLLNDIRILIELDLVFEIDDTYTMNAELLLQRLSPRLSKD